MVPQPLPLVRHFPNRKMPTLQRHIDLSSPEPAVWGWAFCVSLSMTMTPRFFLCQNTGKDLKANQRFIMLVIDPFSAKNGELDR